MTHRKSKKDGKGNLSVDTRRVTTEKAPSPDFSETRKNKAGLLACASKKVTLQKWRPVFSRLEKHMAGAKSGTRGCSRFFTAGIRPTADKEILPWEAYRCSS